MLSLIKKPYLVLIILIATLVLLILCTYKDYGKTWDEDDAVHMGNYALAYYSSFGKDISYFSFYPQAEFYSTRGPVIEVARAAITGLSHNNSPEFYHLIHALFALSGAIFIYLTTYSITRKISLSIVSVLLLITLPRFYGNMFVDGKDIAPLYLLAGGIYFAIQFFKGKRSIVHLIIIGLIFGLGAGVRIVGIYAYILFIVFSLIQEVIVEKKKIKTILFHQAVVGISCIIALHISQPYLINHPINNMIEASSKFPEVMPLLFNGSIYYSDALQWFYLPEYIFITTPIVSLLLFSIGCLVIFLKKRMIPLAYILLLFWIPIIYEVFFTSVLYDSWRHFLFLYAPFVLIATVGLWQLFNAVKKKWHVLLWVLLGVGILLPVYNMVKLHPYQYVYFNELVGGTKGAYSKFELDYWGQSFMEATRWINTHKKEFASSDGVTYVKPCLDKLAQPYLDNDVKIDDSKATLYYCIDRPFLPRSSGFNNVVHKIQREGVTLNTIYSK